MLNRTASNLEGICLDDYQVEDCDFDELVDEADQETQAHDQENLTQEIRQLEREFSAQLREANQYKNGVKKKGYNTNDIDALLKNAEALVKQEASSPTANKLMGEIEEIQKTANKIDCGINHSVAVSILTRNHDHLKYFQEQKTTLKYLSKSLNYLKTAETLISKQIVLVTKSCPTFNTHTTTQDTIMTTDEPLKRARY